MAKEYFLKVVPAVLVLLSLLQGVSALSEGEILEFTTCGSEGRYGPSQSQCDSAYSGTALEGEVNVVGEGIQEWTVPADGYYRFEIAGAAGGDAPSNTANGGHGAKLKGTFELTEGTSLRILVGQKGKGDTENGDSGSGGGGTFVTKYDGNYLPLIVAAGGGGGNEVTDGRPGSASLTTDDSGGSDADRGGAGGGYRSDGQDGDSETGGQAFLNGGLGGVGEVIDGGFGGGGGDGGHNSCGGGGGYSGGSGHNYDSNCGGGGGYPAESFNDGGNTTGESGANTGQGYVTVRSLNESEPGFCDYRGPFNECIMNKTKQLNNQQYNVSSVFEVRGNAVFEAFSGRATLNITNSTSLSGLWRGEFSLQTDNPRIEPGAEFRPENGRIIVGN